MKKEIVSLQVGQCGNAVGSVFWENLLAEHRMDLEGVRSDHEITSTPGVAADDSNDADVEKHEVFFSETGTS